MGVETGQRPDAKTKARYIQTPTPTFILKRIIDAEKMGFKNAHNAGKAHFWPFLGHFGPQIRHFEKPRSLLVIKK